MRKVGERLWDPVHVVNFNLFSMTWGIASYIFGCASQHIGSLQVLDRWCLVVADHELRKHEKRAISKRMYVMTVSRVDLIRLGVDGQPRASCEALSLSRKAVDTASCTGMRWAISPIWCCAYTTSFEDDMVCVGRSRVEGGKHAAENLE